MRVILAGILGAFAMFVWTAIAHMATPLAAIGVSRMSDEHVVLEAMQHGVCTTSGLYYFPWTDMKDSRAMEKEASLMKMNPSGLLIYHPPGADPDMTPMLIKEFVKQLAQSLIAALLLSFALLSAYLARVGFVALLGVFAALGTDSSYWIWYGFPLDYTLAQIIIAVVGSIAAGLVIAAIIKPRPLAAMALGS